MVCALEQCLRNNQAGGSFQWVRSWHKGQALLHNLLRQGRGTGKRKPHKPSRARIMETPECSIPTCTLQPKQDSIPGSTRKKNL